MLIKKLSNINFIKGKCSVGATVTLVSEQEFNVDYVVLSQTKSIINVENSHNNINGLDSFFESIENKYPIFLNIIGKGLIHRFFEDNEIKDLSEKDLLNKIFPNANVEDFVLQKKMVYKGVYISLIRKEALNNILDVFVAKKMYVLDVVLGPFAIENILDISNYERYQCKNLSFNIKNTKLHNFEILQAESKESYNVGDLLIDDENLLSFAIALSFYRNSSFSNLPLKQLTFLNSEFLYKKLANYLGWFLLIATFSVLLINYVFYEHYNKKHSAISMDYSSSIDDFNRLKEMSEKLRLQESFVLDNNLQQISRFSYYADRLALLIPKGVSLTNMNINPLNSELKKNKEVGINKNSVIVSGLVSKNSLLNNWIKEIEKEDWVNDVEIIKFSQRGKGLKAEFNLEIIVNNKTD